VIAACKAFMDDPGITVEGLMEHIPAPDFPTGPLILGQAGARSAYQTGRGSIIMRARHIVEEGRGDRRSIVLTAIPYQVGKNGLVEKIAEAAKDKRIEGVSDIRDESNREGVRVVIDLKRDATPDVVLNQLWRHTPAQASFPANILAIRGGRPETLTLRDIIEAFVKFREEVITRRTKFELNKARERAHILLGLVIAVTNLDEVVRIIRGSASPAEARAALVAREWPVAEIAPYIALVESVEHQAAPTRIVCRIRRSAPSSSCASIVSPRSVATRSAASCASSPPPSPSCLTFSVTASACTASCGRNSTRSRPLSQRRA
jgi:DNA gyrase subunit A